MNKKVIKLAKLGKKKPVFYLKGKDYIHTHEDEVTFQYGGFVYARVLLRSDKKLARVMEPDLQDVGFEYGSYNAVMRRIEAIRFFYQAYFRRKRA